MPLRRGTLRPSRWRRTGSGSPVLLLHPEGHTSFEQVTLHGQALHLPAQSGVLLAHLGRRPLALAPVDALLADPVAERLLDDAELTGDVRDGAVLVDDQGRRVAT